MLTVECTSSIWAQELTYLGGQLLARMKELDPGPHPVERFRFVTRRSPAPAESHPEEALAGCPPQENEPAAPKSSRRDGTLHPADLAAAQRSAGPGR